LKRKILEIIYKKLVFVQFLTIGLILLLFSSCDQTTSIYINYTSDNWKLIEVDRAYAWGKGYINSNALSKVDAILVDENKTFRVETRLKGDWVDHIEGNQWSQRIKGIDSPYWKNMHSFSIMAPAMRNYWKEWLFHKLLQNADVLSTQYFFGHYTIANKQAGYWAVEEHFTETLLENANKPNGPILRFEEDALFDHEVKEWSVEIKSTVPHIQAAEIDVYQGKRWKENSESLEIKKAAENNLLAFQRMTGHVDTLLDLDKWARFYAIVDLCRSYHALAWHNLRYYYNPETKLLEPIGFDGNAANGGGELWSGKATFVPVRNDKVKWGNIKNFNTQLFRDTVFLNKYFEYASAYSSTDWFEPILKEMYASFEKLNRPKELNCNDTLYENWLTKNAIRMKTELAKTEKWTLNQLTFNIVYPEYSIADPAFYINSMVQSKFDQNNQIIELSNFLDIPVICRFETENDSVWYDTLQAYVPPERSMLQFSLPKEPSIKCSIKDTTWNLIVKGAPKQKK